MDSSSFVNDDDDARNENDMNAHNENWPLYKYVEK